MHRAGDNAGCNQGWNMGERLTPSPVVSVVMEDSAATGERFAKRPRFVPSPDSHQLQAASGVVQLLPVIPSPYGDDYLRTSLSTTSIIGIAAA
jgi:hypothetical protein